MRIGQSMADTRNVVGIRKHHHTRNAPYVGVHSRRIEQKDQTNVTGETISRGYVQRYMEINENIISKIPETLIRDFREVAGEDTTKNMTKEFIKIGQDVLNTKDVDATVYAAVCYMLFTADDNAMKITVK